MLTQQSQPKTRLEKNAYYMNPETGSVDIGFIWESEFEDRADKEQDWEDWGGDLLIEVKRGRDDEWVEADKEESGCRCGSFCLNCLGMTERDFLA
jgi:hypothetical protein